MLEQITTLVFAVASCFAIGVLLFSIQTIVRTRRLFYEDYVRRKRKRNED